MSRPHVRRKRRLAARAQKYLCFYCYECIANGKATADHFIPRSRIGGTGHSGNIVAACYECNQLKGNMTGHEYLQSEVLIRLLEKRGRACLLRSWRTVKLRAKQEAKANDAADIRNAI